MATKPFRYRDLGSAAYLSRGHAVVSVGRLHLSGFLAWVIWLFIHIGFLTGFRNRLGALVSWWPAFIRDIRRRTDIHHRAGGTGTQRVRRAVSAGRWHCAARQHDRCRAPQCRR